MNNSKVLSIIIKAQDNASQAFDKLGDKVENATDRINSAVGATVKRIGQIGSVALIAGAAMGVKMNAELETATLQFTTLMGSAEKAEEHVKSLFDFAKKTPFETQPIITASRHLITFGGAALNTKENLTLVGNAAAATSNAIDEVGFWTGRAYNMIQAGKPFGEAAMRLQEMGVLSSESRSKMEELQGAGASASEVFGVFQKDLERFNGAMGRQSTTLAGLTSTLKDVVSLDLGYIFQPLFETTKLAVGALIDFANTSAWTDIKNRARDSVGAVAGELNNIIKAAQGGGLDAAVDYINGLFARLKIGEAINNAVDSIDFSSIVSKIALALFGFIEQIDWANYSGTFTTAFIEMFGGIDWESVTARMVPMIFLAISGSITGAILGIFDWAREDPMQFSVTMFGLLFAPGKAVGAIGSALSKIPLIGTMAKWLFDAIAFVPQLVGEPIRAMFATLGTSGLNGMKSVLANLWIHVFVWIDDAIKAAWNKVGSFAVPFLLMATGAIGAVVSGLAGLAGTVWNYVSSAIGSAASGVGSFISKFASMGHGAVSAIGSALSSLPGVVMGYIDRALGAVRSAPGNIAKAIEGKLGIDIPGFATGGYTGRGGANEVAGLVHKGEYVVPKEQVNQSTGMPMLGGQATFNMYGNINLGDSTAVDRFFDRINAQKEMGNLGVGV